MEKPPTNINLLIDKNYLKELIAGAERSGLDGVSWSIGHPPINFHLEVIDLEKGNKMETKYTAKIVANDSILMHVTTL